MIPALLFQSLRRLPDLTAAGRREVLRDHFMTQHGGTPAETVAAAIRWLHDAQDHSRSHDGGFARHYSVVDGWSTSYPETTGYIIPTLLAWSDRTGDAEPSVRARRALDWLVEIQLPDGGFPGGRIDQTPVVPVTFNTGQILLGLAAGAERWPDDYSRPMIRAADWLRDTLDPDGCWRRFPTPFASAGDKAYETHVAWGLLEAHRILPTSGYQEAALRNVEWALSEQLSNGWFTNNCLKDADAPLTHTIGYVLRGVIEAHRATGHQPYLDAALRTANGAMSALQADGFLPGRLNRQWAGTTPWACLTGNVQIAWCWLYLQQATGGDDFGAAAERAIRYVRNRIQFVSGDGRSGGVKGSFPIDGDYGRYQYLNWAAKFYVDAELSLQDASR